MHRPSSVASRGRPRERVGSALGSAHEQHGSTLNSDAHCLILIDRLRAPAKRSAGAEEKARTRRLPDGSLAHSFRTLLEHLATIVRNTCRTPGAKATASTFQIVTTPSASQRRALELLDAIRV